MRWSIFHFILAQLVQDVIAIVVRNCLKFKASQRQSVTMKPRDTKIFMNCSLCIILVYKPYYCNCYKFIKNMYSASLDLSGNRETDLIVPNTTFQRYHDSDNKELPPVLTTRSICLFFCNHFQGHLYLEVNNVFHWFKAPQCPKISTCYRFDIIYFVKFSTIYIFSFF